ncbi:TPA: type II secretion system protein J [Vibrio vulnificus]
MGKAMSRRSQSTSQQGFTLIEVLIALVVFSSVISLVVIGLEQARSQWERSHNRAEFSKSLSQRHQWLNQMFEQANGAPFQVEFGTTAPLFYGNEIAMRFISDAPIIGGPGAYATVELELVQQKASNQYQLVFRQWPNRDPFLGIPISAQPKDILVVLEGLEAAQFEYFLPPRTEATPMEIRYQNFKTRPEGYWDEKYEANFEQRIPPQIRFSFSLNNKKYQWVFNLPDRSLAGGQLEDFFVQ